MNEAREHTLKFNAPLRAALLRAEPRVADVKGKSELFRKLDDRMKTGDAYVNQGLSAAIAAAEKLPGVELYDLEAAKFALKLRMAILAEDAAGIRKAIHGIRIARGGELKEHRHGLIEAGKAMEARLMARRKVRSTLTPHARRTHAHGFKPPHFNRIFFVSRHHHRENRVNVWTPQVEGACSPPGKR